MSTHPRAILAAYGMEPKKSLGQNFLFDEQVLARIAEAANLQPDDEVLEIGPGLGALTRQLATRARRVVAVELDARLLAPLEQQVGHLRNVDIRHGDILELDLGQLFDGPYKVVANVPYYITGAILRHLLSSDAKPTYLVLTVQKEVAERLTAEPPDMSLLAVSVQYYGQVERVATIKAGAFWPRPDVDSAVIRIEVLPDTASGDEEEAFFRAVRAGFGQKRKQLQKNLRALDLDRSTIRQALQAAEIDGQRRAETVTLEEWRALARALGDE